MLIQTERALPRFTGLTTAEIQYLLISVSVFVKLLARQAGGWCATPPNCQT